MVSLEFIARCYIPYASTVCIARRSGNPSGTASCVGCCERSLSAICFIKSGMRTTSISWPQLRFVLVERVYPTIAIFVILLTLQPMMASYSFLLSINFFVRNRRLRSSHESASPEVSTWSRVLLGRSYANTSSSTSKPPFARLRALTFDRTKHPSYSYHSATSCSKKVIPCPLLTSE